MVNSRTCYFKWFYFLHHSPLIISVDRSANEMPPASVSFLRGQRNNPSTMVIRANQYFTGTLLAIPVNSYIDSLSAIFPGLRSFFASIKTSPFLPSSSSNLLPRFWNPSSKDLYGCSFSSLFFIQYGVVSDSWLAPIISPYNFGLLALR